ncbi:hypothetical protein B0T09DRAFT_106260 [Sordaria sp. MPI-SDFR-AT-0083]|nr:hypothetical protein B0T09DRAFT_106260 [Sordaria sp. MPI-SDFR-AT-0083]
MESSFDEEEKRFLLGEIIKVSVDVPAMINFIKHHNIEQPDWHSIQIPRGRTVNQCIQAYSSMVSRPSFQRPILSPQKRNSVDDSEDHYAKRRAVGPAEERPLYSPMRSYGHQPFPTPIAQPVNIQPRPNGLPSPGIPPPLTSTLSAAPTGRKRGRPKKDESRARQNMPQPNQPIAPAPAVAPSPRTAVSTSQPLSPLSTGYHNSGLYRYSPVTSPYDPVAASKSGQHSLPHPESSVPRTLHMTSSSSDMGPRLAGDYSSSWQGSGALGREQQQHQQQHQQQQTPTSLPAPMEPPVSSSHSSYPTNRSPRLSSGFGGGGGGGGGAAPQHGQTRDTAPTASEQGRSSVQTTSV